MAIIVKALKFVNGIPKEINPTIESIPAKSFLVGGTSGTELTKAILDTLTGGSASDATTLHSHDSRYYRKDQHIDASTGAPDAAKPVVTDASGKVDPSFINENAINHGNLAGLNADHHLQYHNDSRGDARYFQKTEFKDSSAGSADAGKPIKTDAGGKIDGSMIDSADVNHEQVSGLQGGQANQHYHLTQSQHNTLTGGAASDAGALHNHDGRYYTQAQTDAALGLKANDADVIKKSGTVAFTGDQSMGGNKLTNVAAPTVGTDAANRDYVDTQDALKVNKSGDTMSGTLNMNGNAITNVPDPVNGTDVANKQYVDGARAGLIIKDPVRVASTSNIDLSTGGFLTLDGILLASGDRVLVKDQTAAAENGIYVVGGGSWSRSSDADTSTEVKAGLSVWVNEGTENGDSQFALTTNDPITLGTTALTFTKQSGAATITAGIGLLKTGNTLDVNLGAGIKELPTDEIGLDLHTTGSLDLVDPSTGLPSAASDAQLALKLDGTTLQSSSTGLKVKDAGIGTTQLANDSVTQDKIANDAVGADQLAANAVDTAALQNSAVATAKIADDAVTKEKIAADVAGNGLGQNVDGSLEVNVDNSTIEINTDSLRIKDGGVSTSKLAAEAVTPSKIKFGTALSDVNAEHIPVRDTNGRFAEVQVEAVLGEIADATFLDIAAVAGEAIGQNDMVVIRRDASGLAKAYKASAAANDNYVAANKVIQDITYTAITPSGNDISVRYLDPGVVNAALAVSVVGKQITVSLATDGTGAITSTASQIKSAIDVHGTAPLLVSATITGSAAQIQLAQAATFLSGGMDYNDNGRWEVYGQALGAAAFNATFKVKKAGKLTASFVVSPTVQDIGKTVYLSTNLGQVALAAPSATDSGIVALGRLVSLTQIEFRSAILRGVNG
jgi:hypothetical protein